MMQLRAAASLAEPHFATTHRPKAEHLVNDVAAVMTKTSKLSSLLLQVQTQTMAIYISCAAC